MGWVRVNVKPPVMKRHGGDLHAALLANGNVAAADVRKACLQAATDVVERTVAKAGPGTNGDGWPIGPERPWEPGHVHSFTRFSVIDRSRGWYIVITVENPADYVHFIHEPRRPFAMVLPREITGPLDNALRALREQVPRLIGAAIRGDRRG